MGNKGPVRYRKYTEKFKVEAILGGFDLMFRISDLRFAIVRFRKFLHRNLPIQSVVSIQ